MTPEYPVVAQTALLTAAINSPNFNLQNPTASPTPSWAILQNGLAYFFGLVLSGGTITGPDYIINTSGIFIYNGAPALGNLIGSWAGAAGVDAFGNVFPQGFNITMGSISGTTFTGTDFIINTAGAFFYSAAPAAGNLIASIAAASGTDGQGNPYSAGITAYQWISGNQLSVSLSSPIASAAAVTFQNLSFPSFSPPGLYGDSPSGAGSANDQIVLNSGQAASTDVASAITAASATASGVTKGKVTVNAGQVAFTTASSTFLLGDANPAPAFEASGQTYGVDVSLTSDGTVSSGNATSPTLITAAYNTDAQVVGGTTFTLKTWFNGTWGGTVLTVYADIAGVTTSVGAIGGSFVPAAAANDTVNGWLELEIEVISTTACRLHLAGAIHDQTVGANNISTSACAVSGTVATAITFAVGDSIGIAVSFSASQANQTIQTQGSRLTRRVSS